MLRTARTIVLGAALSGVLISACAKDSGEDTFLQPDLDAAPKDAPTADQTTPDAAPEAAPDAQPGDVIIVDVSPSDAGPEGDALVYAHDNTKMYSVDPKDPKLAVTEIGPFDCIGGTGNDSSMTDIAVDKDGKLFGVSETSIFLDMKIEGSSVKCKSTQVAIDAGNNTEAKFFGLTFAPPTAELGTEETLIGANSNGDLYKIDRNSGKITLVGNFGKVPSVDGQGHEYDPDHVGKNWELSGDIVFLTNTGGTPVGFATVRDCPNPPESYNCSKIDTLVEIDISKLKATSSGGTPPIVTKAVRGQVLPAGCTQTSCAFGSMYGIAAWKDKVYGFARDGKLLTIDNTTGQGTLIAATPHSFAGAGVTTLAPVIPPVK